MTGYLFAVILLLSVPRAVTTTPTSPEDHDVTHDHTVLDPYSGDPVLLREDDDVTYDCFLSVDNSSATSFRNILELYLPNLVHFHIYFDGGKRIPVAKEAIMPFHWVWTYYSPDGFFPYLKWPVDFPILSFGLLDAKTQPQKSAIWLNINVNGNCSLKMGEPNTTKLLSYAFRDMTETFLLNLDRTSYSYTYYCFLEEVPGAKETTAYLFAVYFGFPVEFAEYRCCRTGIPKYKTSKMYVECLRHQIPKMFQVTIIPYILGIVAFIYFPIVFMSFSEQLVASGFYQRLHHQGGADDHDWVYLTGKPPLSFTDMVSGFCGLATRYPVAVSRLRRLLFMLLCPCVVYIELYVYKTFQPKMTRELLDHDLPMGYLSMIGGFEKSKKNFMPVLGGPFVMLFLFYVTCFVFILLPNDLNFIMHRGSSISSDNEHVSPLFFGENLIELYSGVDVTVKTGYAKTVALGKGGLGMLVNPTFWAVTFRMQFRRYKLVYEGYLKATRSKIIAAALCFIIAILLFLIGIIEIVLCILYYGMPIVNFIFIASKGYAVSLTNIVTETNQHSLTMWGKIMKFRVARYTIKTLVSCLFIAFVFTFCTIFVSSFSFLSKLLVFSLVSVVVYPSYSFGYLFFGAVLLYYVYKLLKGFGEGYAELLSDAVEVSQHMDEDLMLQTTVWNGTIFLPKIDGGTEITQLNIHDTVINLSTNQRQQIRAALPTRVSRTRERNNAVGVPRDLFELLVRQFRPVHIQVAKSLLWLALVLALMSITISIFVVQPQSRTQGISEVIHVLFIMIVGALPEVFGIILDRSDHATQKDIQLKRIKAAVVQYWVDQHQAESTNSETE